MKDKTTNQPSDSPPVSIVVTTYNHGQYVPMAIADLLEQTYSNFQIVLVNDASPDNTDELIKQQFPKAIADGKLIYIVNEVNKGQPRSREIGIDNAPSEIILFCDSDERYDKHHLEKMFNEFAKGYDCVNQHTSREIDQDGKLITERHKGFPGSVRFKLMLFGLTGSDIITTKKSYLLGWGALAFLG